MRYILKKKRTEHGYTQESFAEELGISVYTYRNIEQGNSFPREKLMKAIMKILKTDSITIFENTDVKKYGNVSKNICKYMNSLGRREYTLDEVKAIKKAILEEREFRRKNNINVNFDRNGKKITNEKIALIASDNLEMKITVRDIELYKRCVRNEFEDRTGKCAWGFPEVRKRLGFNPATGEEL